MKLKVGYVDVMVKAMTPELAASEWAAQACYIPETKTIYIRREHTPQVQASALIHELIHALFDAFGLPKEDLSEEDVCSKLEGPLANVLRDNPRLWGVLRKALAGEKPIVK